MPISSELKLPVQPHNGGKQQRTALLVDDKQSSSALRSILQTEGYRVVAATNPSDASHYFNSVNPDVVFIDVSVSASDGHKTVRMMLADKEHDFIPVIFLSAGMDSRAWARCVDLGGHDYLAKPIQPTLLKAKLRSIERIGLIHKKAMRLYNQMRLDQEMAETVFNGAVIADNLKLDCLNTIIKPAEQFNGDVLLSAHAPSNDVHILLGDFTGHGLTAALGALPAAEVFRAMTAKGFSPHQIIAGINQKLHSLLPTGMFFAIQFIAINHDLDYIKIINCGMPDILLLDGQSGLIRQRFSSQSFPLGIAPDIEFQDLFVRAEITLGDRILLVSDGVTEARNSKNEYFGKNRLEQAIVNKQKNQSALDRVLNALTTFCLDAPQDDDISLAEIPCIAEILPNRVEKNEQYGNAIPTADPSLHDIGAPSKDGPGPLPLEFSITLPGNRLCNADPIPLLINHLQEMEGLHKHRRLLFTLLSELYVNALDHGLLKLDSKMKSLTDGFSEYFSEREKRLQHLHEGFINISMRTYKTEQGGKIKIRLEDSGTGFDLSAIDDYRQQEPEKPCGRGIQLLYSLCESVRYEEPGNKVEVVFSWTN